MCACTHLKVRGQPWVYFLKVSYWPGTHQVTRVAGQSSSHWNYKHAPSYPVIFFYVEFWGIQLRPWWYWREVFSGWAIPLFCLLLQHVKWTFLLLPPQCRACGIAWNQNLKAASKWKLIASYLLLQLLSMTPWAQLCRWLRKEDLWSFISVSPDET